MRVYFRKFDTSLTRRKNMPFWFIDLVWGKFISDWDHFVCIKRLNGCLQVYSLGCLQPFPLRCQGITCQSRLIIILFSCCDCLKGSLFISTFGRRENPQAWQKAIPISRKADIPSGQVLNLAQSVIDIAGRSSRSVLTEFLTIRVVPMNSYHRVW